MQFPVVRDALVESLLWSTDDIYYPVGFKAKCLSGGDMKRAAELGQLGGAVTGNGSYGASGDSPYKGGSKGNSGHADPTKTSGAAQGECTIYHARSSRS